MHGVSDAGTRVLFKFKSGTPGLNEEFDRHRCKTGESLLKYCSDLLT